jgi:hypothetical protein
MFHYRNDAAALTGSTQIDISLRSCHIRRQFLTVIVYDASPPDNADGGSNRATARRVQVASPDSYSLTGDPDMNLCCRITTLFADNSLYGGE